VTEAPFIQHLDQGGLTIPKRSFARWLLRLLNTMQRVIVPSRPNQSIIALACQKDALLRDKDLKNDFVKALSECASHERERLQDGHLCDLFQRFVTRMLHARVGDLVREAKRQFQEGDGGHRSFGRVTVKQPKNWKRQGKGSTSDELPSQNKGKRQDKKKKKKKRSEQNKKLAAAVSVKLSTAALVQSARNVAELSRQRNQERHITATSLLAGISRSKQI